MTMQCDTIQTMSAQPPSPSPSREVAQTRLMTPDHLPYPYPGTCSTHKCSRIDRAVILSPFQRLHELHVQDPRKPSISRQVAHPRTSRSPARTAPDAFIYRRMPRRAGLQVHDPDDRQRVATRSQLMLFEKHGSCAFNLAVVVCKYQKWSKQVSTVSAVDCPLKSTR